MTILEGELSIFVIVVIILAGLVILLFLVMTITNINKEKTVIKNYFSKRESLEQNKRSLTQQILTLKTEKIECTNFSQNTSVVSEKANFQKRIIMLDHQIKNKQEAIKEINKFLNSCQCGKVNNQYRTRHKVWCHKKTGKY